jgi:hypothetical protein
MSPKITHFIINTHLDKQNFTELRLFLKIDIYMGGRRLIGTVADLHTDQKVSGSNPLHGHNLNPCA